MWKVQAPIQISLLHLDMKALREFQDSTLISLWHKTTIKEFLDSILFFTTELLTKAEF